MPLRLLPTIGFAAPFSLCIAATLCASAARAADICKLLTPAEVGAVVGVSMGPGAALNSSIGSSCKWLQQGVDSFKAVTVIVSTKSAQAFQAGKTVMSPAPVAGVGDEAYLTGKSLSYTVLSARKGQSAIVVTVRGLKDVAALQAAEKALGKTAVSRL